MISYCHIQALTGVTSQELLSLLMKDEFVSKQPPKSTGREVRVGVFLSTANLLHVASIHSYPTHSLYIHMYLLCSIEMF